MESRIARHVEGAPEGRAESTTEQEPTRSYGENVRFRVMFRRHEEPGKTPEGMSADFLTDKGIKGAGARASEITTPTVKGYGSRAVGRARQTIALLLENADDTVRVLNARLDQNKKEHGATAAPYRDASGKDLSPSAPLIVRAKDELDPTANLRTLFPKYMEAARATHEAGDPRSVYDITVQQYLDESAETLRAHGIPTHEETAATLAYRLERLMTMTGRVQSNADVQLEHGTHSPKLEPFLREVGVRSTPNEESVRGFSRLEEIGGAMLPGEAVEIDIQRASKNEQPNVRMRFHGIDFTIDMERVHALAESYRKTKKEAKE